ncbi:3-keto-5-aminohexanoate cleavage protein [Sphingobium rhizovicinum]|uniref:3-keto-5-aminohexanoate cleavage protein n=1 Tax=Sphingobium rhizovicinum TaxID=432308 RepID=A0ABV7NJA2_9SPHN
MTCAVTGSSPMPTHPDFPFRPDHVAAEALAAAEAGASIIHVHVRDRETGDPSQALEDYREVVGLIRAKNNEVILNVTTGRAAPGCRGMKTRRLRSRHTDVHGRTAAGTYSRPAARHVHARHLYDAAMGRVAINLDPMITKMGHMIQDAGVLPEIECFEAGDFVFADDLMAKGAIPKHVPFTFVLGTKYGLPATSEAMLYARNQIPRGARFTGFGVSRHSMPMAAQSMLLGGNIRVGFEDTIYLRRGQMAANNADMVRWAVEMVDRMGGDIASAGETRAMLGLKQ